MKNLLLTTALILAFAFCTKKDPEVIEKGNFEDLKGKWISTDSSWVNSQNKYTRDTIQFISNLDYNDNIKLNQPLLLNHSMIFAVDYYRSDSIKLDFILYRTQGPLGPNTPIYDLKVNLDTKENILVIEGFQTIVGNNRFKKFKKI